MAFVAGKDCTFKLDDSTGAGSLRDISAYLTGVDYSDEIAALETTVFTKSAKTRIMGLRDASFSLQGNWDATVDGYLSGHPSGLRSWEFGPAGLTGGLVKYSGEGVLTNYRVSDPVDGLVTWTADLAVSDTITRGTW